MRLNLVPAMSARQIQAAVASLIFLASACATTNLDKNAAFQKDNREAVVILAAPERSTVWLYEGVDDGVNRSCGGFLKPAVRLSAERGFVVAKLPPRTGNEKYALAELATNPEAGHGLRPGQAVRIPVFNAAPGQVTFLGGVSLLGVGHGLDLVPDPSVTPARAARYLASSYPRITGPVVKGKMDWVYLSGDCSRL